MNHGILKGGQKKVPIFSAGFFQRTSNVNISETVCPIYFKLSHLLTLVISGQTSFSCYHVPGRPDEGASITAENMTITFHSIFLAVCGGSAATETTVYTLLAIDFIINLGFTSLVFYR